ncbi:hypothetical protein PoB_001378200 [Plakobranchus ocellatus]|uniref:Uncharacterized protein n=1 Tax=Plakobranchus ocellatus TaxID=259542 RepID=A0AAV3YYJ5_9GAST|nr:hypothetical protein PoB_001378200 [Plakobranchus ocellatus]
MAPVRYSITYRTGAMEPFLFVCTNNSFSSFVLVYLFLVSGADKRQRLRFVIKMVKRWSSLSYGPIAKRRRVTVKPYYRRGLKHGRFYMPNWRRRYGSTNYGAVKRLRDRRRAYSTKKTFRFVCRTRHTMTPDAEGIIRYVTSPTTNLINILATREAMRSLFDEFKIVRQIDKFRLEKSADVLNDEANEDIMHWSCYDPDAGGRTFHAPTDF